MYNINKSINKEKYFISPFSGQHNKINYFCKSCYSVATGFGKHNKPCSDDNIVQINGVIEFPSIKKSKKYWKKFIKQFIDCKFI